MIVRSFIFLRTRIRASSRSSCRQAVQSIAVFHRETGNVTQDQRYRQRRNPICRMRDYRTFNKSLRRSWLRRAVVRSMSGPLTFVGVRKFCIRHDVRASAIVALNREKRVGQSKRRRPKTTSEWLKPFGRSSAVRQYPSADARQVPLRWAPCPSRGGPG